MSKNLAAGSDINELVNCGVRELTNQEATLVSGGLSTDFDFPVKPPPRQQFLPAGKGWADIPEDVREKEIGWESPL
jgi:hypothetical protein